MENNEISLKVSGLTAGYSNQKVFSPILKDVFLELKRGELLCLCGLNGSGKSTLLSIIAGIFFPNIKFYSDEVPKIFGKPITKLKNRERASKISFMPQNEDFAWNFSVQETIESGFYARKETLSQKEIKNQINDVLNTLKISNLAERDIFSLSGGELQKVRIARALIQSSSFIILDEPCSNLDFCYEEELLNILKKWAKEKNIGILISIHNINAVPPVADKICLLPKGKKTIFGTVEECFSSENLSLTYEKELKVWQHPLKNCLQV